MRKSVKQLEHEIKCLQRTINDNRLFYDQVIERQAKRFEALEKAWRRVHPEDQAFMREFSKSNKDSDLFDIYNGLLYSFGRADENGRVFTRLDSWNK
uniref:Uncharacterized protein n=1 Tax=viral metagenome TaxID=1070528 RepID=A0A6M3ILY6_9ZZZZ